MKITDFQNFMLWYYNMLHRSPRCQNYVESLSWICPVYTEKDLSNYGLEYLFFSSAKSKGLCIFSLLRPFFGQFPDFTACSGKVCVVSPLKSCCDFHNFVLAGSIRHLVIDSFHYGHFTTRWTGKDIGTPNVLILNNFFEGGFWGTFSCLKTLWIDTFANFISTHQLYDNNIFLQWRNFTEEIFSSWLESGKFCEF